MYMFCHIFNVVLLLIAQTLGSAAECGVPSAVRECVQSDGLHFLFVGNSFTSVNNLPGMFAKMAVAGGYRGYTYFSGFGSATFRTHYLDPKLPFYVNMRFALPKGQSSKWDAIIMQEQSMFLSQAPSVYKQNSVPWAIKLYNMFANATTKVLLYETWGYKNGNPSAMTGLDDDYYKMQNRLWGGYNYTMQSIASSEGSTFFRTPVDIVPVGQAWAVAQKKLPKRMWQQDGMHPQPSGTYLAACVFYAKFFNRSPVGNKYVPKGVTAKNAKLLQKIAADTVSTLLRK